MSRQTGSQRPNRLLILLKCPAMESRVLILLPCLTLLCILMVAGCATSVGSQKGDYRTGLGTSTSPEIVDMTRETLRTEYGYSLDREIVSNDQIRFTTNWQVHNLNLDERKEGVTSCRTRVEIRARPKRRLGGDVREYRVEMKAEYQTQTEDGNWTHDTIPKSRANYFDELAQLIKNRFKSGLRGV